jgi:hypothetical protein
MKKNERRIKETEKRREEIGTEREREREMKENKNNILLI